MLLGKYETVDMIRGSKNLLAAFGAMVGTSTRHFYRSCCLYEKICVDGYIPASAFCAENHEKWLSCDTTTPVPWRASSYEKNTALVNPSLSSLYGITRCAGQLHSRLKALRVRHQNELEKTELTNYAYLKLLPIFEVVRFLERRLCVR